MKQYFAVLLAVLINSHAWACDVCGGSAGGFGFGYLTGFKNNFVSLSYQNQRYLSTHPKLFENEITKQSNDIFENIEVSYRHAIGNRWIAVAQLPFKHNMLISEKTYATAGIGDISLTGIYKLISQGNTTTEKQLVWQLGLKAGLPTGKNNLLFDGVWIANMQHGSGSWSLAANSIYFYRMKQLGISGEILAKTNGANVNQYQFGNEILINQDFFYRIKTSKGAYLPTFGIEFLSRAKDWENKQNLEKNVYSGVASTSAVGGLSMYRNKFGMRIFGQMPIKSTISNGYVSAKPSLKFQFIYLIPSKNLKTTQNENT
ncbi:MAG: hypothetical protein H6607_10840 [Flavobacteriales bacterium]|nr:hypothetical protein [Flavobacteriales bacterium]